MALTKADIAEYLFECVGLNKRESKELVEATHSNKYSAISAFVNAITSPSI
jgi:nucleoid DNA-binding protein